MGKLRDRIGVEVLCLGLWIMHDQSLKTFLGKTIDYGLQKAEEADIMQTPIEGIMVVTVTPPE